MENVEKLMQLAGEAFDKEDYEKTVDYLRQAAEQGDREAILGMGYHYMYGKGVEKILKKPLHGIKKQQSLESQLLCMLWGQRTVVTIMTVKI